MSTTKSFEQRLTNFMAGSIPWLAPVPSAALVVNATQKHLTWSEPIAIIAGAVIEGLGLTSTSTALTLWDFNARRPENEPKAPFWIAALMVGVYFAGTIGLTVFLDIDNGLTHIAPAIFPVLAIVATVNIALRSQHAHRLERIALAEQAAKADSEKAKQEAMKAAADAKADQLRRDMESRAEAERLRLERKADRAARQTTRQVSRHDATGVALDRDTFVRLFTTSDYTEVEDLAHSLGFNGELAAYYTSGKRSVSRLASLTNIHPRTAQRWIDAANVASNVAISEVQP